MNILYPLFLHAMSGRARAFEKATLDPITTQENTLLEYLRRNKDTEYGKKHGFPKIRSIEEYRQRVPLSGYEDVRPYIDRIARGEENIMTSDKVTFFAITTGTTSKQKLIPETDYSRGKKGEQIALWSYYIARKYPAIFDGKILAIISAEVDGLTEGGLPYGAESGHGYMSLPPFIRRLYALPYDIFNIKDYETRYYCILRFGMEEDVRTIVTLNPYTILLLCKRAQTLKERIIDDIEKGTLDRSLEVPGKIREKIERGLRPNPRRAKELKDIAALHGELLPKYFWPKLQLIECWKGGTVKIFLKELAHYFGGVPVRDIGCLSSEARSSIPVTDEGAGGILAINTNFYEFIPKEDIDKKTRRTLLCNQIEKGRDYFIIVTNPAGLYRYDIDDIVRVDGFFNKTPVIEFVQKGLHATSLAGEKLYESHVVEAVDKASRGAGMTISSFSACAETREGLAPGYAFLVEFEEKASRDRKKSFMKMVEDELCVQNEEYKEKRMAGMLGAPVLKAVRKGEFEKYRADKVRRGAHDSQFKLTELVSDPGFQKNFAIEEEISL